jgi:hypothetical protein
MNFHTNDRSASFHSFHAFIDGLIRPLHDIGRPLGKIPSNSLHQHIASVHHYPLVAVIEKPPGPVTHFEAPRRGTEWPAHHQFERIPEPE